jgi:hypothetical protein
MISIAQTDLQTKYKEAAALQAQNEIKTLESDLKAATADPQ